MARRSVVNTMSDITLHDMGNVNSRLSSALQDSLVVLEHGLQQGKGFCGSTVYVGLAGIALTYFRLYECCTRVDVTKLPGQLAWAGKNSASGYLQRAAALINAAGTSPRLTFHEGQPAIHAVKAAILHAQGGLTAAQAEADKLQQLGPAVLQMPEGECELLYGRSGYLYALLFTQKYLGSSAIRPDLVKALVQQIVDEGRRGAARVASAPLMWSWHSKYYLGGAHGVSGILHTLLLACDMNDQAELYPGMNLLNLIEKTTEALAATLQGNNSNIASTWGSDSDRLVQWCHGAPGFLPLVAKVYQRHPTDYFGSATQTAAEVVWTRGLLLKGVGLCHGISGNAYTLLSAYRSTGEERYLRRALQFGVFMAGHWQELLNVPDRPLSLYEGLGGAMCFWADVMDPLRSNFPGYEL